MNNYFILSQICVISSSNILTIPISYKIQYNFPYLLQLYTFIFSTFFLYFPFLSMFAYICVCVCVEGDFFMLSVWRRNSRVYLWKVPENHTMKWPKPCEGNWIDRTVQRPSMASTKSHVIIQTVDHAFSPRNCN